MADDMKFRHALPVQIRFSDVDQYGHMNNSSYFSLYDLAKTSYMRDVFGTRLRRAEDVFPPVIGVAAHKGGVYKTSSGT